jgi:DNA-directed RNA polymerase specialized sigma24 family protein
MTLITPLIARFRSGSRSAFGQLFTLFYPRQVQQAGAALRWGRPGRDDPEDVALSAFHALWREVAEGRFPDGLDDTAGLLGVLRLLTDQKIDRARRYDLQLKRDRRRTVRLPDRPDDLGPAPQAAPVLDPVGDLPPAVTPQQRAIVALIAEGWLRDEIAARLGCSVRTVHRELAAVRAALRDRPAD